MDKITDVYPFIHYLFKSVNICKIIFKALPQPSSITVTEPQYKISAIYKYGLSLFILQS